MTNETSLDRLKTKWPIIIIGVVLICLAFALDWIGLSAPGKFSTFQIILVAMGLLGLVIGWLGRGVVSFYRGTAILLLNTIAILIFLELASAVAIRALDWFPSAPAPQVELPYYSTQDWAEQYWSEFAVSESNRYFPWVVWRRRPFTGNTININEDGIRLTPGADCGPDSYTVFAFGGSTMWGSGAPDWGTIPAYLQQGLESLSDKPVCIINFGEAGFVSTQGVVGLIIELQSGNVPHLVIFYDGINDVFAASQSGKGGVHQNLSDIADRFKRRNSKHPLVVWLNRFYLSSLLERFIPEGPRNGRETLTFEDLGVDAETLADRVVQAYLGNYRLVDTLAQQYDFEYYFFWQPSILVGEKSLTAEEQVFRSSVDHFPTAVNLFEPTYQRIEHVADDYPNLYYIANTFDDVDHQLWIEHTHVTPEGNQLMAQRMLEVIRSSALQVVR